MSLTRLLISFGAIFVWLAISQSIKDKRIVVTAIFFVALLVTVLFSSIKASPMFSALLQIAAITLVFSELLREIFLKDSSRKITKRGLNRKIILIATGLMLLIGLHNIGDISTLIGKFGWEALDVLNPWGLFLTIFIVSNLASFRQDIHHDIKESPIFRLCIFGAAITFGIILLLVYLRYLPGNTEKVAEGIGGIGFASMSTNEAALLGSCLLIWVLMLQKSHGVSLVSLISLISSIVIILLTKSRTGIICAGIIFVLYIFSIEKHRARNIFIALLVAAIFSIPAFNAMEERMSMDEGISSGSGYATGSGRLIIWASYFDVFSDVAAQKPLTWLIGVGPVGLLDLYDKTFLCELKLEVANGEFFPLHSDLVFTFLTTGALGLLLWSALLITLYFKVSSNGFNFAGLAAVSVFVVCSSIDMVTYSSCATWLIAMTIANSENKPMN